MNTKTEKKLLKLSMLGALFFALLGVVWGIVVNSEMIVFDGLYSFISLLLTSLSLITFNYICKKDVKKYPYGKDILEPILIAFKSIVIISMCVFSLTNAIKDILNGGVIVDIKSAFIYSLISTLGCLIIYLTLKRYSCKIKSDLLKAESNQWLVDTIVSGGVLIGFIIVLIIRNTSFEYIVKFIDPSMLIMASLLFLRIPIKTLILSVKEIIGTSIPHSTKSEVNNYLTKVKKEHSLNDYVLKVLKVGRLIKIDIKFTVDKDFTIEELDIIRNSIQSHINKKFNKNDLNIIFTSE